MTTYPDYVVWFRGKPACPCLATWLPAYEAELQRRGILTGPLTIYQLIGGYAASGGTHATGGAFDLLDLPGAEDLEVGRQMGADAYWTRPEGWDNGTGIRHNHGVLTGCPHNGPARYQITAVRGGFNGLGHLGQGAPDDGPRPLSGRTWRQGIAWARQQQEEHDMTPQQEQLLKQVAGDVADLKDAVAKLQAHENRRDNATKQRLQKLIKQGKADAAELREIAAALGVDDDA